MSQITTHVLDTAQGIPAEGIVISLFQRRQENWALIADGATNRDGRIADLLSSDTVLLPGQYKMIFELEDYFERFGRKAFYPYVEIVFMVNGNEHYHIPLLLSPYGYSTYRGS